MNNLVSFIPIFSERLNYGYYRPFNIIKEFKYLAKKFQLYLYSIDNSGGEEILTKLKIKKINKIHICNLSELLNTKEIKIDLLCEEIVKHSSLKYSTIWNMVHVITICRNPYSGIWSAFQSDSFRIAVDIADIKKIIEYLFPGMLEGEVDAMTLKYYI